jgi:cellulose synthase/poly-beta-1,6-N-acetylglucosamine synthase-like glycosyltransferase
MVLRLTTEIYPVFIPFGLIGLYRYIWYLIKIAGWLMYRPIKPKLHPKYISSRDVTIVVPTIDAGEEFIEAAHSWLVNKPKEILIITEEKMKGPLQELAQKVDPERIRVLTVGKANKRVQMVEGIKNTHTDILVFADDDAIWRPDLLRWVLACYEDDLMGGVGTQQRVKCMGKRLTVWEVLAAFRLTQRNIEIAASCHIDNGICCLSGRTAAYRTCILKDPAFMHGFTNDFWLGKYPLNSGDDKFLTRWMVSHGWKMWAQVCNEAELLSTFKDNWRFLKQVLRWTRNTWRSDFRSLFTERFIWTRHPYTAFSMIDKFFSPFTLLSGPVTITYACVKGYPLPIWVIVISYLVWLMITRALKLIPHWLQRPQDIIHIPAWILFSYYFVIMKIYALFTLHVVAWGTRAGVDPMDDKKKEKEEVQEDEKSIARPPSVFFSPTRGNCDSLLISCPVVNGAGPETLRRQYGPYNSHAAPFSSPYSRVYPSNHQRQSCITDAISIDLK